LRSDASTQAGSGSIVHLDVGINLARFVQDDFVTDCAPFAHDFAFAACDFAGIRPQIFILDTARTGRITGVSRCLRPGSATARQRRVGVTRRFGRAPNRRAGPANRRLAVHQRRLVAEGRSMPISPV
jgi:hypothetical protein